MTKFWLRLAIFSLRRTQKKMTGRTTNIAYGGYIKEPPEGPGWARIRLEAL